MLGGGVGGVAEGEGDPGEVKELGSVGLEEGFIEVSWLDATHGTVFAVIDDGAGARWDAFFDKVGPNSVLVCPNDM